MSQENFTETARLLAAEIAMAVVQSIRNDKDVIGRVAEILLPEISRIRRDATAEGIKAGMNAATAALINNNSEPDPAEITAVIEAERDAGSHSKKE